MLVMGWTTGGARIKVGSSRQGVVHRPLPCGDTGGQMEALDVGGTSDVCFGLGPWRVVLPPVR